MVWQTNMKHPEIIIIGAGPGGLAAALLLAQAGVPVRIFDRLPRVGGRCSALEAGGFRFDLGPTFFLYPLVLQRIFGLIGRNLHQEIEMVKLDPQYRLVFGQGGELLCRSDVHRMAEEIHKLSEFDAPALERFLADNRNKMARFRPCLESPFPGLRSLFRWELIKLLPLLRPWRSLDRELAHYFTDPRVRLAFSFQSKYLGMSPFQCPSLFSILSFLEYEYGVFHPMGGCSAVSEKMAEVASDMGVTISLNEDVEQILFEGRKAIGIKTSRGEYRCDALVINADFARAMTRLVPDKVRRRWTDRKINNKKFSCSTFMVYLGIDGIYDNLDHHTIYMAKDYTANLADIETNHRLSEDPSFYVQNASVTDPTLAPRNCSTLYILAPVTHKHPQVDWSCSRKPFRDRLLKNLEKIGISNLEKRIRYEKIVTPADWENHYEVFRGATFNLAHNLKQMLHRRPQNRFEDLESVYLVGGGTHPGSGLPVIYESARITSRLLLADFGLDSHWIDDSWKQQDESHLALS